jgi:hypothetical protein
MVNVRLAPAAAKVGDRLDNVGAGTTLKLNVLLVPPPVVTENVPLLALLATFTETVICVPLSTVGVPTRVMPALGVTVVPPATKLVPVSVTE